MKGQDIIHNVGRVAIVLMKAIFITIFYVIKFMLYFVFFIFVGVLLSQSRRRW